MPFVGDCQRPTPACSPSSPAYSLLLSFIFPSILFSTTPCSPFPILPFLFLPSHYHPLPSPPSPLPLTPSNREVTNGTPAGQTAASSRGPSTTSSLLGGSWRRLVMASGVAGRNWGNAGKLAQGSGTEGTATKWQGKNCLWGNGGGDKGGTDFWVNGGEV